MICAMESPFVYGKMAESEFFIDREKETAQLLGNFKSLVNTALIGAYSVAVWALLRHRPVKNNNQ